MKKRREFLGLGAAAALAAALPASAATAFRILLIRTDGVKSLLWAQQQKLFEKRGLDVSFITMGSGAATLPALLGGSGEIGAGSLFPMFAAHVRGLPIKLVSPASLYQSDHADSWLLVKPDSPIRTARDLSGKIVGVDALNDVYTLSTRAWVDENGGDGSTIKPVELPPSGQLAALEAGRIDAGVFKTPFGSIALSSRRARLLAKPLDAIAPRFLLSSWVSSDDVIAKMPQQIKDFQAAVQEAARYTNAHQDQTVDLVANFTGQSPDDVRNSVRATSAITCTLAELQRPVDFAAKYKLIAKGFDVREMLAPGFPLSG
jgi:NitT/TauT family transport system substrate-binding protein